MKLKGIKKRKLVKRHSQLHFSFDFKSACYFLLFLLIIVGAAYYISSSLKSVSYSPDELMIQEEILTEVSSFILLDLTIDFPLAQNNNFPISSLEYNTSNLSATDKCWVYNGTTNSSVVVGSEKRVTGLVYNQGENNWTLFCNSTTGNLSSKKVTFSVDTIAPAVAFVGINPIYLVGSNVTVNLTKGADAVSTWWNNGSANLTYTSPVILSNLPLGTYNFVAYTNDSLGNLNTTLISFRIRTSLDEVPPYIAFINSFNSTYKYGASILVNLTNSSDTNKTWIFNGKNNVSYTSPTYIALPEGNYTITAYANDSAGNINSTSVSFVVNATDIKINITYPVNGMIYSGLVSKVNYTFVNETSLQKCWVSMGNSDYAISEPGVNFANLTSINGSNNWRVKCNDSFGETYLKLVTFRVDLACTNCTRTTFVTSNTNATNANNLPSETADYIPVDTTAQDAVSDAATTDTSSSNSLMIWIIVGIIVLIIVISIVIYFLMRAPKVDNASKPVVSSDPISRIPPELVAQSKEFVRRSRLDGRSDLEIARSFQSQGWDRSSIDFFLR